MKAIFIGLVAGLCLLGGPTAYCQAKLTALEAYGLYEAENEPSELAITLQFIAPEEVKTLQFTVLDSANQPLLHYSLLRKEVEEKTYYTDGDHMFLVFRNSISLTMPIDELYGKAAWKQLLVQGYSNNGLLINSLLASRD